MVGSALSEAKAFYKRTRPRFRGYQFHIMASEQMAETTKPYVRVATLDDLDEFVQVANRAFLHDPAFNYSANLQKLIDPKVDADESRRRGDLHLFLAKSCFLAGGRVTVVVDPESNGRIAAGALWMPPRKRLAIWQLYLLFKAGFGRVLQHWKLTGFLRMIIEYHDGAEKKMKRCFQEKGVKEPPEDAWYVQQIFTDPDYQGRGLMSTLMREAFANAPEATFCLEASTAKSRDQYAHLGFENPIPIPMGVGKCNTSGLRATGKDATGVEIYAMGRWPSKQ
ncbi:unnamed protein product [Cyclocybe aegerita]|uniref:N-acetyltransferase domain-containing protein n=1 Tax=Cyclocybe aegerita TaxID=1973307 RepID=A0A8S0VR51_CYCAE|nr:unnamed protein product [Cyclocybe aegerita]